MSTILPTTFFLLLFHENKLLRAKFLSQQAVLSSEFCIQEAKCELRLVSLQCQCTEQSSLCTHMQMVLMPATIIDISEFKINSDNNHTLEATGQEANRLEA